jgi:hypothetical protein
MANLLMWKDGEGYDIVVLRNQVPSKALDSTLDIDPNFPLAQFPLQFDPHFKGAPNAQGVQVDTTTGVVTASPAPTPNLRSFVMTARQTGTSLETVIRFHVRESIKKIWLTPSSLTTHEGADECRFTVLAQFDDDTVGDITDWPQLTYDVSNPSSLPPAAIAVHVFNRGDDFNGAPETIGGRVHGRVIPGETPDQPHDVVVTLQLANPPTNLTATAKVFTRPSWIDVAKDPSTEVRWVAGPQVPNINDFSSSKADSIASVTKSRANILFISEGFAKEDDFRKKVVELTVKELRTQDQHEPFKLLSGSINYWSVFVPTNDEGVGILGENAIIAGKKPSASAVPLPVAPTLTQWTIQNMVHEAGLPLPADPPAANAAAWFAGRAPFFNIPPTVSVDPGSLSDWNDLRQRTLLNERNTPFGIAHYDRPLASGQGIGEERLVHDPRRISELSIKAFVENLQFNGFPIGSTWEEQSGPDFGRVCFVCHSSKTGGTAVRAYFAAGTGQAAGARVTAATTTPGMDVVPRPIDTSFSVPIYTSVVSHECGHALGLGDEYGGGDTFDVNVHSIPDGPNLQVDTLLAPTDPATGLRSFDTGKIKWLWPRVTKAGVLIAQPDFQGDPDPVEFLIRLSAGDGKAFAKDDLVRIRQSPVHTAPANDPFAGILLRIDLPVRGDDISVAYVNPGGPHVDLSLINPAKRLVLICTSIKPNTEFALVADPILNQIANSNGPLNAAAGSNHAACVVGAGSSVMTPKNLPKLTRSPKTKADIIGLYEGGGYHDCGVFRPAGRCRLRTGFLATIPFCHVCRYIIVDAIDPRKHGDLDSRFYDKVYPS